MTPAAVRLKCLMVGLRGPTHEIIDFRGSRRWGL
jgi:hypothetical protein